MHGYGLRVSMHGSLVRPRPTGNRTRRARPRRRARAGRSHMACMRCSACIDIDLRRAADRPEARACTRGASPHADMHCVICMTHRHSSTGDEASGVRPSIDQIGTNANPGTVLLHGSIASRYSVRRCPLNSSLRLDRSQRSRFSDEANTGTTPGKAAQLPF